MSSNSSLLGVENTNASSPINQIFGSEPPSKYLTSTGSSSTSATRTPNPEHKDLDTGQVLLQGLLNDGLYKFTIQPSHKRLHHSELNTKSVFNTVVPKSNTHLLDLSHRRLETDTQESSRDDGNIGGITQSLSPMEPQHQIDYGMNTQLQSTSVHLMITRIHSLNSQFALKDLGKLSYFLEVEVSYPTNGGELFHDVHLYRSVVGALQYATLTHPEISYSVNKACQFIHTPKHTHWQLVKRILRYLKGVLYHALWLSKSDNMSLDGFVDADWASDSDDRKSTSGFCVYFGNNLVSWGSKKQSIIDRSSTKAEYRCLTLLATELVWIRSLLNDLYIDLPFPPILWCDNLSAVHLSANSILHSTTKHVELDIYFVRDLIQKGKLFVRHLSATEQIADILTKPLSAQSSHKLKNKLTVIDSASIGLQGVLR
ncbi:putative mitochondrial protein [Cucumis melo var. makuwa]|uniref:Mitochondrial protein n=1 Tax=Cucumis melo var. makuwa TaxID=1194695 RepID=A0A5A7UVQ3_CUCMM|nr:putative mitochondrial protein [Cucumis melo var. makuwa]